ncbi:MAG: TrmH family RNA methyltransferase [Desulfomonilia bacterium]
MKTSPRHCIMRCSAHACGLRFPVLEGDPRGTVCPMCRAPAHQVHGPYEEHEAPPLSTPEELPTIHVLLDNIRSIYNVGSIFRTSDGVHVEHIYLCGITPTPHNPRLKKTALGSDEVISWSYHQDGYKTAQALIAQGKRLWALEGGGNSESLFSSSIEVPNAPIVLVIGNEVCGVDPGILSMCEKILGIPMGGIKTSLNTAVAFGIAVYTLRFNHERLLPAGEDTF